MSLQLLFGLQPLLIPISQVPHGGAPDSALLRGSPELAESSSRCCVHTNADLGGRAAHSSAMRSTMPWDGEWTLLPGLSYQMRYGKKELNNVSWQKSSVLCMYTHINIYLISFTLDYCVNFEYWLCFCLPAHFLFARETCRFTAQYPPGSKNDILFSTSMIKMQWSKAERGEMCLLLRLRRDQCRIRRCLGGPRQDPQTRRPAVVLALCLLKSLFFS